MDSVMYELQTEWRRAINNEQVSHDFYLAMAQKSTSPVLKSFFETLAAEETKHKQRLEEEYRRAFQSDLG